jgi:hypothetical protein
LSNHSNKINFDHLALRNPSNTAKYEKINQIKGIPLFHTMVFSDYIYKLDQNMKKEKLVILVADEELYLLKSNGSTFKYRCSLS